MRLLVVSTWLPYPLDNGSRVRAYYLLRHLATNHSITLVTFGPPEMAVELKDLRDVCARIELARPVCRRTTPRDLLARVPRHFRSTDNPEMRWRVASQVDGYEAALAFQVEAARYLAPHRRLPRLFEEAEIGLFEEMSGRAATWPQAVRARLTTWKFRHFIRGLIAQFDGCTVVSEQERRHLEAIGCDPGRITVVPNGVHAPDLGPTNRARDRLIYPGSIMYSANLEAVRHFAKQILPLIRRSHPNVTFWITGATDGVPHGDLATVPGVTFTGRLPTVDQIIAESAVCVVPLLTGGGTRLKVLHAMAVGTPVVSTSKGVEGLSIQEDRHALIADDAEEFAREVVRLLDNRELASRLASAARELVARDYGWDSSGRALDAALERAIRSHRS